MRARESKDGISVHAISGTHVVILGLNATEQARHGLLGFAIRRIDHTENEDYWLFGTKVFRSVVPEPDLDDPPVSTLDHPIQSFLWGDYTAKPDHRYTFIIRPMRGQPGALVPGTDVEVTIRTEDEDDGTHAIYFNRGAITSQAYSRKYGSSPPPEPDNPAHEQTAWLSRGLLEAAIGFIDRARPGEVLRSAAYEFASAPIIDAFKRAHARGVDVKICYEAGSSKVNGVLTPTSTTTMNAKAIEDHSVPEAILIKRLNRKAIPHNKFIVRVAGGVAQEVWTGSTNFTMSGFLGQSNVGHLVRDTVVASQYLAYWMELSQDREWAPLRAFVMQRSPHPAADLAQGDTVLLSPRTSSKMLGWYSDRIRAAERSVMFTAAFGVSKTLVPAFAEDRDFLRFILTEKDSSPATAALFRRDRDLLISKGSTLGRDAFQRKIPGWQLDKWFHDEEHFRGTRGHVFYVHTKYCLIDPLGDDPMVFSGSANFSSASLLNNDENMLLIRGNRRVADIYLGEFDRLFRHFWFRQFANQARGRGAAAAKAKFLAEDDSWTIPDFTEGNFKQRRRQMLA
jgi:phosphatidylserine/phosphatidylglycerophosphate/cardiolipin synthase-like enzyme